MKPKKIIHWLIAAALILYVITGYGITDFRIVTPLTLGIFDKPTSMKIHEGLGIPFIIILMVHIYLSFFKKKRKKD
jgi:cytochrome b subunit of formate dehydrogenase